MCGLLKSCFLYICLDRTQLATQRLWVYIMTLIIIDPNNTCKYKLLYISFDWWNTTEAYGGNFFFSLLLVNPICIPSLLHCGPSKFRIC